MSTPQTAAQTPNQARQRPKLTLPDTPARPRPKEAVAPSLKPKTKRVDHPFSPEDVRTFRVEGEDGLRELSICRHSIGWLIEHKTDPGKTILGLRNNAAKPIPVCAPKSEIEPWWKAGFTTRPAVERR